MRIGLYLLIVVTVINIRGVAKAENTKENEYDNAIGAVKYKDQRFNTPLIVYEKIDGAVKYSHLEICQDGQLNFNYGESSLGSKLKQKYLSRIIETFKKNIWKEGEGDSYEKWACPDSGNGIIRYKLTFKKKTFYTSSKDTLSQVFLNIIPELNELTDAIKKKEKELWKSVLIQHKNILCVWERNDILGIRKNGKVYSIGTKGACNFVKTLEQEEMQQMINFFNEKRVFELGTMMVKLTGENVELAQSKEAKDISMAMEDTSKKYKSSLLVDPEKSKETRDSILLLLKEPKTELTMPLKIEISGSLADRKTLAYPPLPYPDKVKKQGISVSLSMEINVDTEGNVIGQPVILSKTSDPDWDNSVAKWFKDKWKWEKTLSETKGVITVKIAWIE